MHGLLQSATGFFKTGNSIVYLLLLGVFQICHQPIKRRKFDPHCHGQGLYAKCKHGASVLSSVAAFITG